MRIRIFKKLFVVCAFILFPAVSGFAQWLETPAERVTYQEGGTLYAPLMEFIYDLESRSPELMNVERIATTLGGRDVVLCIVSDPPVFSPEDVVKTGKSVVLIVNNVHGGEVAGKDASLELMRDLVVGDLRPLLKEIVLLDVPTINPDGAEVRRRTNEQGFDLNRDYIKLESQEIGALVADVINRWKPDIHVDTHHGGRPPYTLTYQTNMNPAGDPELVRLGNNVILPRVREALRKENYDGFWYSGPGEVDGVYGWKPTSVEPRKQHVYSTLANMVGFLFETPSCTHRVTDNGTRVEVIPENERYRHQVRGQYIGQREILRFAAENGDMLRHFVGSARMRAVERGDNDSDDDQIPLRYHQTVKDYEDFWVPAEGNNSRGLDSLDRPINFKLMNGPVFTLFKPTVTTTRPWGYLMPPGLAKVVPLLLKHRISVKKLTEPATVTAEVYYAREIREKQYFQGHYLKEVTAEKHTETVDLPAGSFFIPAGQAKSNLLCYLLEPETDDNLVTWGFLDDFLHLMHEGDELQRIPVYRLTKRTPLSGILVEPYEGNAENVYFTW